MVSCAANPRPFLIAILGPTATGKSSLALRLAEEFDGEIVNCDSRQIYRDMLIGTAAPTDAERDRVPHHLFGRISPETLFSAGDYQPLARDCLHDILKRGRTPIFVGGTGFYFAALTEGLHQVPVDEEVRNRVEDRLHSGGLPGLLDELRRLDPAALTIIDTKNPRRVARALEIVTITGKPLAHTLQDRNPLNARVLAFRIDVSRPLLHARIDARVDEMIRLGLENEVRELEVTYGFAAPGLQTIGYSEWQSCFAGSQTREETAFLIKQHTRQYAKRQETWFARRSVFTPIAADESGYRQTRAAVAAFLGLANQPMVLGRFSEK
jgi:tRNA dimethylallyltransferase